MLARYKRELDEPVIVPRRLLAVGSILHLARDNDVVWGSGVHGKIVVRRHQFKQLDAREVRGPLTRWKATAA